MKVFKKIKTEGSQKELLLLSGHSMTDSKITLHILIDKNKGEFIAKKIKLKEPIDESSWEIQTGYTFPSSIFYEFIKDPENL